MSGVISLPEEAGDWSDVLDLSYAIFLQSLGWNVMDERKSGLASGRASANELFSSR